MEPGHWPSEHSDALRDYFLKGMSYAEIGRQINGRFGTAYTRNAVAGRAKRLGTRGTGADDEFLDRAVLAVRSLSHRAAPCGGAEPELATKIRNEPARVKLRCVGVQPRLVALGELGRDDCRYPYGGEDGEGSPSAAIRASRAPAIARRMLA